MLASDEWKKVIYIRDPKQRILSAYLQWVADDDGSYIRGKCCPEQGVCANIARESFEGFLHVAGVCRNAHWTPQTWRMEGRYWAYMDEINPIEEASVTVKALLEDLGAWDDFGASGWGEDGSERIFPEDYRTSAWTQWQDYYDDDTEPLVEDMYQEDYNNPYFDYDSEVDDYLATSAEDEYDENKNEIEQIEEAEKEVKEEEEAEGEDEKEDPKELEAKIGLKCGATVVEKIPDKDTKVSVDANHYIFQKEWWDGAPVVIENFKLIFFTNPGMAATTFKMLFRRMMGLGDWEVVNESLPNDPTENGLWYLYDYSIEQAQEILTSKEWTRAIFTRDPKERILATYLDVKLGGNNMMLDYCCLDDGDCWESATKSFDGFLGLTRKCCSPDWIPQTARMEGRYWPQINFIGHIDIVADDTKDMLSLLGSDVWTNFGASGWGEDGSKAIFEADNTKTIGKAQDLMGEYYTDETEKLVEQIYADDYENRVLGLESTKIMVGNHDEGENNRKLTSVGQAHETDAWSTVDFIRSVVGNDKFRRMLRGNGRSLSDDFGVGDKKRRSLRQSN